MRFALVIAVVAFTVVYVSLMVKRIELARLEDAHYAAESGAHRPVAGASVTTPGLDNV